VAWPGIDAERLADQVATLCGVGSTLMVGHNPAVLDALRRLGVDVHASDAEVGAGPTSEGEASSPVRLAGVDDRFECVLVLNALESLRGGKSELALAQWHRVSARYVFVVIDADAGGVPAESSRAHWEALLFGAGFRKHPAYYRLNHYEELNREGGPLLIPLEKVPGQSPVAPGYGDPLRQSSAWADAQVSRYQWAADYVRPGDRVLVAACNTGFGCHVLKYLSEAASVFGVDDDGQAIDQGTAAYAASQPTLSLVADPLIPLLEGQTEGSFDVIVAFDSLGQEAEPSTLLAQFARVLSPGGRLILGVATGAGASVVGDGQGSLGASGSWSWLHSRLPPSLLAEQAFAQTAGFGADEDSLTAMRTFHAFDERAREAPAAEWLFLVAMKNPVGAHGQPYRESVYGYSAPPRHLMAFARDYRNPWLLRALVEFPFRARNPRVLRRIADQVLTDPANRGLPDEAAALAVVGYQLLAQGDEAASTKLIARLHAYLDGAERSPHGLRWRISLSYLLAMLHRDGGRLQQAAELLAELAEVDCRSFSPTIGTKIVDAAYEGGMLRAALGDMPGARQLWKTGVRQAFTLLCEPIEEFVGELDYPQHFPGAVAVELLDSATRSVRALRWSSACSHGAQSRLFEQSRQSWKWMIHERARAVTSNEAMIRSRDVALRRMEEMIADRDSAIAAQTTLIQERDALVVRQGGELAGHVATIRRMNDMIADRDSAITAQAALITDRDCALAAQATVISQREEALARATQRLEDLEQLQSSVVVRFLQKIGLVRKTGGSRE
jgi:SAM-dependent methyltransferase